MTPILLVGAGRMGGALIAGWRPAGAFSPDGLMIRDPAPGAEAAGVRRADRSRSHARWAARQHRGAGGEAADLARGRCRASRLTWRPDAVIVSIAAGVASADIAAAFGGRRVARVMPTTAAAIGQGTASIFAPDAEARARAHALFAPVGTVVDLDDEDLMHAATAVSGSAPAYLYAFVEALEAAGVSLGLPADAARDLARATIAGAAALMADSGAEAAELRRQVTSPGGTTEAALKVLLGEGGLPDAAAKRRWPRRSAAPDAPANWRIC